jgi:molybdate transport system substrate-binding protein
MKRTGLLAPLFAALLFSGFATAAEIKVLAVLVVKDAYSEAVAKFEQATGHKVTTIWTGSEAGAKRIRDGEATDLAILGATSVDPLVKENKLAEPAVFAKSGIGVAVRAGLPKPDISSADGVKNAVLAARTVMVSSGPSGNYIVEMLKKMGIYDQVKDKVKQPPSGSKIGDLVASGEADLVLYQISGLMDVKGVDFLGPLPAAVQYVTVYTIGLHTAAAQPEAAKALIKALTSPDTAPAVKKMGMEPN